MRIEFDWDPQKAADNQQKHNVSFDEAMTVLADPLALTRPDEDPNDAAEERWITIGLSRATRLVLVVHTHVQIEDEVIYVRIISARLPTRRETNQYENEPEN